MIIEVEDDGRGIDVARVREVARERNVASQAALDGMSDDEVIDLIFAPGFSTAAEVTDLSGRGVGMDVGADLDRAPGRAGHRVEQAATRHDRAASPCPSP